MTAIGMHSVTLLDGNALGLRGCNLAIHGSFGGRKMLPTRRHELKQRHIRTSLVRCSHTCLPGGDVSCITSQSLSHRNRRPHSASVAVKNKKSSPS